MSRSNRNHTLAWSLIAVFASACSAPLAVPTSGMDLASGAGSAVVASDLAPASVGWQAQARTLIGSANMSPLAAARVLAAVGVAQYQALASVKDADGDDQASGTGVGSGGRRSYEAERGAVASASATVLSFFFPAAATTLAQRVVTEGESTPGNTHPHYAAGVAAGRSAGEAMVDRVRTDRFTTPWTGTVPTGPGMWIANGPPAGATFGGVVPYFLTSGSQFRPAPPPAFGSPAFLADLAEITTIAANRTAAQQAIAVQWNYATGTFTPPGYWNKVAGEYIEAYGLNERAAAHTFALTNAAMMDALIGCWDAKYFYWTIRPSQANSAISLSFGLPNHPSYPSGHSCVSAAATTVLGHLFPDRVADLEAGLEEAGLSRMYAGIHYRFDINAGRDLGRAVAHWAIEQDAQPGLISAITR